MLEQKDLKMIKDIVENVVQNSEDRMISRIHESEGRMESKMEALISESEDRMESKMEAIISESEDRMESKMESLISESEGRMESKVESLISESEDRMGSKMEVLISESEDRIESKMEALISESEGKMESLISESENRMESKMEALIHESENMVLGELDRVQVNLGKRIDKVEQNLDELNQYYRIIKLDHDNTAILLKTIGDHEKSIVALSKRVDVLENDKNQHRYEQHKFLRYRGDLRKRHW